jgi:sensor histidine kinase YesM
MEVFTENFRNVVFVFVLTIMLVFSFVMLFSIDRLVTKLTKAQLRAELSAVEAQINPHFIYNVLDRINWVAIDNGQDRISNMLNGLASLLRYSINNIDMLVPLAAEIEWMQKYIYIQNERFGRDIIFTCEIEDRWDFNIHKMLLQPLVENSILHGFEGHEGIAEIRLLAQMRDDGRVEITLKDNGCGINPQALKNVRSVIGNREQALSNNIGISNVSARLWHYYGKSAAMEISSCLGEGTEVRLLIPPKE